MLDDDTYRVVGIDTKSTGMHWVSNFRVGIGEETYGWTTCKNEHPDPRRQADLRRIQIFQYCCRMARSLPRGVNVYCEEPLALQNGQTTRFLGLVAGAVWAAFHANSDICWHWVDSAHWKKTVLGRGNPPKDFALTPKSTRTKRWIAECVLNDPLFQLESDPVMLEDFARERDLYDAWAIRRYGVIHQSQ